MRAPSAAATDRGKALAWLATLAAAVALGGCASKSAVNSHSSAPAPPHVGETSTVEGAHASERITVTLLAFVPSITGGANDHPEFNMQYAAAELRLTNVGSVAYTQAPADSVIVISNEGQKSKRAQLSEGSCTDAFAREVDIAPGHSAQGCVPMQVPVVASPATLTFAAFGKRTRHTAEWSLTKPRKLS